MKVFWTGCQFGPGDSPLFSRLLFFQTHSTPQRGFDLVYCTSPIVDALQQITGPSRHSWSSKQCSSMVAAFRSRNRWTMATSATYGAIFSRDRNFSGVGKNSLLKNYIRLVDQINKKESRVKNPFLALHLRHPTPSRQVDITVIHLLAT